MARKIIIGLTLIILGFVSFSYYPQAIYHLSWEQMDNAITKTSELTDLTELTENYYTYKYAIERDFDNVEVWGAMSDSQKEKWINKCYGKACIVCALFIISGILVLSIPVKKKKDRDTQKLKHQKLVSKLAKETDQD